jgi:hypothetical protein
MEVPLDGKKVVVYDVIGPYATENKCFDRKVASDYWYNYSSTDLFEACWQKGIALITPDVYFALPVKPKAIAARERDDADMSVSLALKKAGVKLVYVRSSENPLYACQFYWNLPRITKEFDHSIVMSGVKDWVAKSSHFMPQYTPHGYWAHVKKVESNFQEKKFLCMVQRNARVHWARRWYVNVMNVLKPMPNFVNREGYLDRLEAVEYFSKFSDFDLFGIGWDKPVRYTEKYNEAIKKSWRGAVDDKFETLKEYKFSLCFENSYLGGYVQYMKDAIYAGSVPIYWGAPDIADIFPKNCFIDFRTFDCDYAKLNDYLRTMDEKTYNEYIDNINAFIASPRGYAISKEKYIEDMINLFESYF